MVKQDCTTGPWWFESQYFNTGLMQGRRFRCIWFTAEVRTISVFSPCKMDFSPHETSSHMCQLLMGIFQCRMRLQPREITRSAVGRRSNHTAVESSVWLKSLKPSQWQWCSERLELPKHVCTRALHCSLNVFRCENANVWMNKNWILNGLYPASFLLYSLCNF